MLNDLQPPKPITFRFAYLCIIRLDIAKWFRLDTVYKHQGGSSIIARLQYSNLSSAFNTIQHHILSNKLLTPFLLDQRLTMWIVDFLTNISQRVLVNNTFSDLLHTSTGAPQRCVSLHPLLFILYTDDGRKTTNCHLVKFANDMLLLSLLSRPTLDCRAALHEFCGVVQPFLSGHERPQKQRHGGVIRFI